MSSTSLWRDVPNPNSAGYDQRLKLLAEASSRLLSSLNVADVLTSILELSPQIMAAEAYGIWRLKGQFWEPVVVSEGLSDSYRRSAVSSSGEIADTPLIFGDVEAEAQLASRRELYRAEGIRALLAMPLKIRGQNTGTLVFYYRAARRFGETELDLAAALANLAGSAITTAELYEQQQNLTRASEEAQRKATFLSEASHILSSSLDYDITLNSVAQLAVGRIADWCTVDVIERGDVPRRVAMAHVDPEKLQWAADLRKRYPPDGNSGPYRVMRSGEAELVSRIEDDQLVRAARNEEHLRILRQVGLVSYMCVPMVARDHILGAITFVSCEPAREYGESDLALARELACRCGIAIDNSLLYLEARENEIRQRKAQEDVLARERRFRALLENSADGIMLAAPDGTVLDVIHPILGYAAAESVGQNAFSFVHPDDLAAVQTAVRSLIAESGQVITGLYRVRDVKGEWRWAEALVKNLLADPNINAMVVTYRDVTERKNLEDQLRQTAKLESLGVLAGGVAHDFNNLLVGILGNASLASDMLPSDSALQPMLREVVTGSERAARLTQQLLAYAGKGEFIIEPLDLSKLVEEIGTLIRTSISRSVILHLELERGLPVIAADTTQLQQLIMNLVINGAEAIGEDRTGTVLVTTGQQNWEEAQIRAMWGRAEIAPGPYVFLEVRDTGCGMDEATLARIFDPFFTTKFTGRGLGLAAVMGIVRGHKGALQVYSRPGQGTTFRVLFPVVESMAARMRPQEELPARAPAPTTVLLIDDEDAVRRVGKRALEEYGFSVLVAEDGQAGANLFRDHAAQISLVLLDMTMPVMSGEQALRELRAIRPDVKVVLSSGFNELEAVQRFNGQGLAGFIQKPYTAATLVRAVGRAITAKT